MEVINIAVDLGPENGDVAFVVKRFNGRIFNVFNLSYLFPLELDSYGLFYLPN